MKELRDLKWFNLVSVRSQSGFSIWFLNLGFESGFMQFGYGDGDCYAVGSVGAESCTDRYSSQFKNNYFTEICSGSETGSYLRLIDFCITQL